MHHSVNATMCHCISQFLNTLINSGTNSGLLGGDVHILEHAPSDVVNIVGVAGAKVTNLKLTQAAALVEMMASGPIIVIVS